jgi:hypothetical protein
VKRLQAKGDNTGKSSWYSSHRYADETGAAEIELDVEVIIQALKLFGQRYNIAGVQALRAERYRKSTVEEMKFMEQEEGLDGGFDEDL